jgi:hypothetical protein
MAQRLIQGLRISRHYWRCGESFAEIANKFVRICVSTSLERDLLVLNTAFNSGFLAPKQSLQRAGSRFSQKG